MKSKLAMAALSALFVSGCVTWGQLDDGLKGLLDQPISVAIDKLGYPSTEQTIAGTKLYRWGRSAQGTAYVPTSSTTYGAAMTPAGLSSYNTTTTGGYVMPVQYNCNLTLAVDKNDIIRHYESNGNLGGCEAYIKALKR